MESRTHGRREIDDKHVGPADELAQDALPFRALQIEGDAAFIAIRQLPHVVGRGNGIRRNFEEVPRRIARSRRFDFDDIRTEIGQNGGGRRSGDEGCDIQHLQIGE